MWINLKFKYWLAVFLVLGVFLVACQEKPHKDLGVNTEGEKRKVTQLLLTIDQGTFTVKLADNQATKALTNRLAQGPLEVTVSSYGGFEKVGSLTQKLPTKDEQLTAKPGDIMLYQGNKLVFFYGTNSWSYTKIGHVVAKDFPAVLKASEAPIKLQLK